MLYAIEAMESQYQGLHGIVTHELFEGTFDEALEYGHEASIDVIYAYGLEPEPDEGEDWESEEICEEAWSEATMFSIWEVPDTKGKTIQELSEMFYNCPDSFIEEFCKDC